MAWKIEGQYFENCSCDVPCPCTVSLDLGADRDRCNAFLVFQVESGEVDGVDVGGLTVAAMADTPKVMSEGNWRLGVLIDDQASDEQTEKLGAVFGGQLGGPMEALGPLVSEQLGVERVSMEVSHENGTHRHQDRRRRRDGGAGDRLLRQGERRAGEADQHLPSGGRGPHDRQGDQVQRERVRHRLRLRGTLRRSPTRSPGRPSLGGRRAQRPLGSTSARARAARAARRTTRARRASPGWLRTIEWAAWSPRRGCTSEASAST